MEDAQAQHSRSGKPLWSNRIISYNRLHVISLHRALASSLHTFLFPSISFWWYTKIIQLRNSRAICRIRWLTPKSAAAASLHIYFTSETSSSRRAYSAMLRSAIFWEFHEEMKSHSHCRELMIWLAADAKRGRALMACRVLLHAHNVHTHHVLLQSIERESAMEWKEDI